MKKFILTVLMISVLAISTLTANEYPEIVRVEFIRNCIKGDTTYSVCLCSLKEIQNTWSLKEYNALGVRIRYDLLTSWDKKELRRISKICSSQ